MCAQEQSRARTQLTKGELWRGRRWSRGGSLCDMQSMEWRKRRGQGHEKPYICRKTIGLSTVCKDVKGRTLAVAVYPRLPHCLWSVADRGER